LLSAPAAALPAAEPVIDLLHASWTAREGAPAGITGITQTPDGWIWVGGTSGLYKFDGVRFVRASGAEAPLSSNISAIGVLPDGLLWVGYQYGGVSLMTQGRMRHYRVGEPGVPAGNVVGAARDAQGRLWLATGRGLHVLDTNGHWHLPDPALAAPTRTNQSILLDRRGTLWVRGVEGVYALRRDGTRFEKRAPVVTFGLLALHPDGSVWTNADEPDGALHPLTGDRGVARPWPLPRHTNRFTIDHDGYAWASDRTGVFRAGAAEVHEPAQRMGVEQGLSGRKIQALFEDREHNVWVGTESGLDRFRAPRLRAAAMPEQLTSNSIPIAGGAGASVWADHSFVADPRTPSRVYARAPAGLDDVITALYRGHDGRVWAAGFAGLWAVAPDGSGWRHLYPGDGTTIYAMTQDSAGTLWMAMGRRGVAAWRDGQWIPGGGVPGLTTFAAATVAADAHGRVWIGSTGNDLALLASGRVRHFGPADGLAVGTVVQVLPADDGAWVGGENGLMHFDGTRFTPVEGREREPFAGITGLVFARDGTLWVNGADGISSIAPDELRRVAREPGYRVRFDRLDYRDGLRGTASAIRPVPSATRSDDGTLWFTTVGGLFGFDPATLPRNTLVPPVVITGLSSASTAFPATDGTRLPAGTDTLDVEFTALSYREPGRMAFRYRLDGVDGDWHEGRLRSAHYINLGPGHYRFHVQASNDDGVWNTQGATLSFDVEPRLTQTLWFHVLCGAAALFTAWRAQLFWMRRTARRLAVRMGERVAERERIARELHDTLLQSIQGLMLMFWSATGRIAPDVRAPLEAALARASRVVAEGRDRVVGLRTSAVPDADLAQALRRFAEPLARDAGIAFHLYTDGRPRKLRDAAADEAFAIAREALWNAFAHAKARALTVTLQYAPSGLTVTIADDGIGLPDDVDPERGRAHHWGFVGMRERAHTLGAALALTSAPGAGTTWTLRVPGTVAFA
jgi:signal transduction histidine kinase/ligand-binding sensor domain-containing protein